MNKDMSVSIKIALRTKTRLMRRMKYGDSFDSAINEFLDELDKVAPVKPSDTEQPQVEQENK